MAETLTLPLRDDPDVKKLIDLLSAPGFQTQLRDYTSTLDYVDTLTNQYNAIMTELSVLKEQLGTMIDNKNPIIVILDNHSNVVSDIGEKLKAIKDGIVEFTKNTLKTVKDKGLSALGAISGALHIHESLDAISKGLNSAAAKCKSLEQFHTERVSALGGDESKAETRLSELLADTRLDFENLSPDELKTVYEKLLSAGMDNGLTSDENTRLQHLVEQAESLLPEQPENSHAHEQEIEAEQGAEM